MTATEYVILVDKTDQEVGQAEKLLAHQNNWLHRAFSVFILRKTRELEILLQQRALQKYHSPGLWTNTCCSHPRAGEAVISAGERRLQEEFGFSVPLIDLGWFHYNAHFDNGLSEHEIDHVLIGTIENNQPILPNPHEIHTYRWITLPALESELSANPRVFTPWLQEALLIVKKYLLINNG